MLKKKNILIAIVITIFFLTIASQTTFRIAIYAFVVCYIGVIIAKSRNKRLKVPVPDFFILTFTVGIFFSLFYAYSPKLQYYEFVILHSRWDSYKVTKVKIVENNFIELNENFVLGNATQTDLIFSDSLKNFSLKHQIDYYETNLVKLISQNFNSNVLREASVNNIQSNTDFYIFAKPDKKNYKVFNKNLLISNPHTLANLIFSIFYIFLIVSAICFFFFKFFIKRIKLSTSC